jgi:hypothetical protein
MAMMPIFTGSDGTPGRAWAPAVTGKAAAPAAAAVPTTLRKSRLLVAILSSLVIEC